MLLTRRSTLALVAAAPVVAYGAPLTATSSAAADTPFSERGLGAATTPVTAIEYFSLTCTHCAHFANVTMPRVQSALVDTGKLRLVYRDFPLDAVALMAAQVARSLPAAQYYPFVEALFASQDDWAFTPGIDYKQAIFKYAALAGMDKAGYDAALGNAKLKAFIEQEEQNAETTYKINSTPTFIINGKVMPGAMEYDDFAAAVAAAASAKA